jgi:hypothetical protein
MVFPCGEGSTVQVDKQKLIVVTKDKSVEATLAVDTLHKAQALWLRDFPYLLRANYVARNNARLSWRNLGNRRREM